MQKVKEGETLSSGWGKGSQGVVSTGQKAELAFLTGFLRAIPLGRLSSHFLPLTRSEGRYETMYIELGALSDLHLKVSQGDLVHDPSPADVNKAFALAKYGYQQLREFLVPGRTFFNITLCFDEHTTKAVFQVLTVVHQESGHPKSDVVGGYQPCCNQILDERIRSFIALVYNYYILANRRAFNDAWYGIPSSLIRLRWS